MGLVLRKDLVRVTGYPKEEHIFNFTVLERGGWGRIRVSDHTSLLKILSANMTIPCNSTYDVVSATSSKKSTALHTSNKNFLPMTSIQIWFVDEIQFSICPVKLLFLIIQRQSIWPIYVRVDYNGAVWPIHPSTFYLWHFSPVCPIHEPIIILKREKTKKRKQSRINLQLEHWIQLPVKAKARSLFCRDNAYGALFYWVRYTRPVKHNGTKLLYKKLKTNNFRQTHSTMSRYTSCVSFFGSSEKIWDIQRILTIISEFNIKQQR